MGRGTGACWRRCKRAVERKKSGRGAKSANHNPPTKIFVALVWPWWPRTLVRHSWSPMASGAS